MATRSLRTKGQVDYDYAHDILFFKAVDREYFKSIEIDNIVIDIDKESLIVGIQIFEASKFLNVNKNTLLDILQWEFRTIVNDGRIEIRLIFQIIVRNKVVEKNPIIMQPIFETLPNSELICEVR